MELVKLTIQDNIAIVSLNRPEKRNALNPELLHALSKTFSAIQQNESIDVVILEGKGSTFCAGADLAYLQKISEYTIIENFEDSGLLEKVFYQIFTFPKPVIAKVHGPAIAGGCGLATICDIIVAAKDSARFGYTEVRIGFIAAVVMVYLIRKIGDTHARRLLLTAEPIDAEEACRIGLVSYVVPDEELDTFCISLAKRLSQNSASAMALTKTMLTALHGMSLESGLEYARTMNALTRFTDDCKAGIARFLHRGKEKK